MSPEELKRATLKAKDFLKTDAVTILSVEGQKHFRNSFQRGVEGFVDEKLVPWKDIQEKTKRRKRRKNGSLPPVLTDKGHLRDSIDYNADFNKQEAVFSSNQPYAQVHNEGGQAGKNGSATIPQRGFMGPSKELERKVVDKIERTLDNIFK